jgi:hypothetical protein
MMNLSIWTSISRRFVHSISLSRSNDRLARPCQQLLPQIQSSLEGIISYLTLKCGGNVHNRGIITVTASSEGGLEWAKNVVDFQNRTL